MSPMLLPTRFQLDEAQLAASLALGGIGLGKDSVVPHLDAPPQPALMLQDTGMLTEDGQRLNAEAEATLRVVANPARMLSVVANSVDRPVWVETIFVHGDGEGPFVSLAIDNKKYDFALLPTVAQATVLIDDMLGLTEMTSRPGKAPINLTLPGYAAALAMADVLQAARLEARLARARRPVPSLSPEILERQLQEGLAGTDTRWAVTAGRMVCPSRLGLATSRMKEGLAALQTAGLAAPAPEGHTLTQAGYMLGSSLGQLTITAGFSLAVASGQDQLTIAHVSLFRTAVAIWLATWASVSEQDAVVHLFEVSDASALGLVRGLLEPVDLREISPPAPPAGEPPLVTQPTPAPTATRVSNVCPSCGAENAPEARFCAVCNTPMSRPPAPVPPPPAAPTSARCPNCGTPLPGGARFCSQCGTAIAAPPTPATTRRATRICPACGHANRAHFDFCVRCGTALPGS